MKLGLHLFISDDHAAAVRDRLAAYREAGVGTLLVNPMGSSVEDRLGQMRILAELAG